MQPAYIAQDEAGVSGQMISFTQGDTKTCKVFLFNADGSPMFLPLGATEVVAKIFTQIAQPSIVKKLSLASVSLIQDAILGTFGFAFQLLTADTAMMAANNSGLPLRTTWTMADGSTRELDFLAVFSVEVPTVQT